MRVAVVDIGTNSTRLLVADVSDGQVTEIDRRNTVTRLGRGVDLSRQLCADAIEDVCAAIGEYLAIYEQLGAERVVALATSAVRDSSNGDAFIAELRERFALDARVLSGEEEAALTYLGTTNGREDSGERTLVIDIGGGSTELVVGSGSEVEFHASLQAGVVRHTERYLQSDPPQIEELEALADDAHALISAAVDSDPAAVAARGIAVAGTPTSLAAIEMALEPYDPGRVHKHRLSLASVQHMLSELASKPRAERRQVPGLHAERAPTIVAGVVILVQAMRAFRLDEVEVSEQDILWGAALQAAMAPA